MINEKVGFMAELYKGSEKRRSKRLRASFIVIYRVRNQSDIFMFIEDTAITGLMLDLSDTGMSIATDYDISLLTVLSIEFTLINPYAGLRTEVRKVEVTGEVRNVSFLNDREERIGIFFTKITQEDRKALVDFVHARPQR